MRNNWSCTLPVALLRADARLEVNRAGFCPEASVQRQCLVFAPLSDSTVRVEQLVLSAPIQNTPCVHSKQNKQTHDQVLPWRPRCWGPCRWSSSGLPWQPPALSSLAERRKRQEGQTVNEEETCGVDLKDLERTEWMSELCGETLETESEKQGGKREGRNEGKMDGWRGRPQRDLWFLEWSQEWKPHHGNSETLMYTHLYTQQGSFREGGGTGWGETEIWSGSHVTVFNKKTTTKKTLNNQESDCFKHKLVVKSLNYKTNIKF